ncbi:MAG: HAMP domain-containing sensor histidine kinase [Lachnospiraceae bacterium]
MSKWYRSAPCKGILVVLAHVMVMIMVACVTFGVEYPGKEYSRALTDVSKEKYSETKGFAENAKSASREILLNIENQKNFETEGKYNANKIVDISKYHTKAVVSGDEKSSFAYKLGDLVKMGRAGAIEYKQIVVCQNPNETYDYYSKLKFKELIQQKQLHLKPTENYKDYTTDEMLDMMESGGVTEENRMATIQDAEGQMRYKDFWILEVETFPNLGATISGKTMEEMATEDPKWNGKLHEAYDILQNTVNSLTVEVSRYRENQDTWTEGNTNLAYLFADMDAKKVYTNREAYGSFEDAKENIKQMMEDGKGENGAYLVVAPKLSEFGSNMEVTAASCRDMVNQHIKEKGNYVFAVLVDTKYPIQDGFYVQDQVYRQYMPWMGLILIAGTSATVLLLIIFMWLTIVAGRTRESGELKLVWFDKLKTEIGITIIAGLCVAMVVCIGSGVDYFVNMNIGSTVDGTISVLNQTFWRAAVVTGAFALFLTGYLSLIRRLKAKTLWSNSLCRWIWKFIGEIFRNRSYTTRGILCYGGFVLIHWILYASGGNAFFLFLTMVLEALCLVYIVKNAIARHRIKEGIERIAGGEVDYNIPLTGMKGDNLEVAVRINNIGEGLNTAMEENLKNERLKTDLITNVSHDIKTPLTSIINYVDLLKREHFTDPKILGYLDVLEAKAQRLKTLTEDVVEASKISSGNIKLEFMNLNLVEMINQTNGEFTEKFEKRNLQVVLNIPVEPVVICADGRRIWRVLENIYNNAAKYAMEGTRIYADMNVTPKTVAFSLKNISEQPLNITADELTERFIRGDVSRSTEGSGLGLSIAKSLTELQNGQFHLYLDGDLFKITIVFPKVYRKQEQEETTNS